MNQSIAMPHLTLSSKNIEAEAWKVGHEGRVFTNPERLDGWDYSSAVRVRRHVCVDMEAAAVQLEIPLEELRLAAALSVGSGRGTVARLKSHPRVFPIDPSGALEIDEALESEWLSARISVDFCIVLRKRPSLHGPMSPTWAGTMLWRDYFDLAVEPLEPRFPMEAISFKRRFAGTSKARSLWFLHWLDYDALRDLRGALRLYVNQDNKAFIERLQGLDSLTLQTLMSDVVQQVCERVLREPDLDALAVAALESPASIAGQAVSWLGLAFPGESLVQVATILEERGNEFASVMQAVAELEVDSG